MDDNMADCARFCQDWPGKSVSEGEPYPALCHMLDVAAVAEALLAYEPLTPLQRDGFTLLAFLHDIGKMGPAFRDMLRYGTPQGRYRHWEVSEAILHAHTVELAAGLEVGAAIFKHLRAAVSGHHGRPVVLCEAGSDLVRMRRPFDETTRAAHRRVIALAQTLWPKASLAGLDAARAQRLSWWFNGLLTAADWIGSNEAWFPRQGWSPDPVAHLAAARQRAAAAIAEAGIARPLPAGTAAMVHQPRPLQRAVGTVPLPEGPILAILEDETGAGKTEAALMLARRMIAAGKGRGLYLAMPTMATSDAMFDRVRAAARALFDGRPSLVLAHGRAALHEGFAAVRGTAQAAEDEPGCAPWLAESRRRAFMAEIGVGTVDQALLAVLRTRYSALRLWGLSSKILIVDEAHSYDDGYTATLVARLLECHAALGGSAILLTATLPLQQRQLLADAFAAGAGQETAILDDPAYPALSVSGTAPVTGFATASPKGPVAVARLGDSDAAQEAVATAARAGAAVAWVRNAVDDAIAAAAHLRAQGLDVDLLHARMTGVDRQRAEAAVLAHFGKDRAPAPGRVLVATQVVESSLDLDLDAMVSDLAPMAALIQRAGRLWRHMDRRPAAARPVAGPLLQVLMPDPASVTSTNWLRGTLDRGAFVYSPAVLWRTARALLAAGEIAAPYGIRALIESVHGDAAPPVPLPLESAEQYWLGGFAAERSLASDNRIDFDEGYGRGAAGADDRHYPTRLGRAQTTLLLLRMGAGGLEPWAGPDGAENRALSEVSAATSRLDRIAFPDTHAAAIAALARDWPDWQRPGGAATPCVVAPDGRIAEGLRYDAVRGLVFD